MQTPCIHCQQPFSSPGVCANCKTNQNKLASSKFGEANAPRSAPPTVSSTTPFQITCQTPAAARQQQPHGVNDHQTQLTQQLQARSKLTLQPKPVRLTTTPRVLSCSSRPRLSQGVVGNSSASQVSQQVQHQIRHRFRIQSPRQSVGVVPLAGTTTKYRILPNNNFQHRLCGAQAPKQPNAAPNNVIVKGSSSSSPIRIISSTSSAHIPSPGATVIHAANSAVNGRVTHVVRTVNPPVAVHSVVPSQQLVKVVEPTVSAVVSPTTPSVPSQYRVTVSNGQTPSLYKILYPISPRPAIAGLSSSQLTPLTIGSSQVVSSVLVTPSGAFQVLRHAANPPTQNPQFTTVKQITHQSMSIMGPAQGRVLRSKPVPSVQQRLLAIEPPHVVTIDDEDVCTNEAGREEPDCPEDGEKMMDTNYYALTTLEPRREDFKGVYCIRARKMQIGTFLLRDRLVTFSRNTLQILVRPVDSLTDEVELTFDYSEIMKTLYALSAETPAIIFNFSPGCGERVRKALHMKHHDAVCQRNSDDAKFPYFEPRSQFEKHKQVVIFLGESLSQEDISLIQDCYQSPRGIVKRAFAERLLAMTESRVDTPETPVFSGDSSQPTHIKSGDADQPGTSFVFRAGAKKLKLCNTATTKYVTSNGIVTVTPGAAGVQCTPITSDVLFTSDSPLCQYPPTGKGLSVIRAPDLLTLLPDTSVNDAVIDFYLSYIIGEQLPKKRAEKVFAFNTFFYSSLVKDPLKTANTGIPEARRQHANVKRWTKGVDLFAKDFILIPVCEHSHWFLIIVCYPWLVPKRHGIDLNSLNTELGDQSLMENSTDESPDPECGAIESAKSTPDSSGATSAQKKTDPRGAIYVFDSLRGNVTASKIYTLIRNYLAEEFLVKKGVACSFDYYSMRGYCPIGPQQTNLHDCGIFLLEYAKQFLLKAPAPEDLGQANMFTKLFDPKSIMEKGRWEVAEVMFKLSEQQFPELKGVPRSRYEKLIKIEGKTESEEARNPQRRKRLELTPS